MTQNIEKTHKIKQLCLQAPFNLAEWIDKQAKLERRSVSSQIVYLLEKAMEDAKSK